MGNDKCKHSGPIKGIYLITADGGILGHENKERLTRLPWYKQLWAKVNKQYRNRFINVDCINIK